MKHIKLIIHKLSGSRDNYGTIAHHIDIPDEYTYIDLANYIVSKKYLESEGLVQYLEKDGNFVYDFFKDFQDSAVIKNLDDIVPVDSSIIFSPNYYNYPKDPSITLNYVYIRKDMRNMRWMKYTSTLSKKDGLLMSENDFECDVDAPETPLGALCWTVSFMGLFGKSRK